MAEPAVTRPCLPGKPTGHLDRQHDRSEAVLIALVWCVGILLIASALAVVAYRRKIA